MCFCLGSRISPRGPTLCRLCVSIVFVALASPMHIFSMSWLSKESIYQPLLFILRLPWCYLAWTSLLSHCVPILLLLFRYLSLVDFQDTMTCCTLTFYSSLADALLPLFGIALSLSRFCFTPLLLDLHIAMILIVLTLGFYASCLRLAISTFPSPQWRICAHVTFDSLCQSRLTLRFSIAMIFYCHLCVVCVALVWLSGAMILNVICLRVCCFRSVFSSRAACIASHCVQIVC